MTVPAKYAIVVRPRNQIFKCKRHHLLADSSYYSCLKSRSKKLELRNHRAVLRNPAHSLQLWSDQVIKWPFLRNKQYVTVSQRWNECLPGTVGVWHGHLAVLISQLSSQAALPLSLQSRGGHTSCGEWEPTSGAGEGAAVLLLTSVGFTVAVR